MTRAQNVTFDELSPDTKAFCECVRAAGGRFHFSKWDYDNENVLGWEVTMDGVRYRDAYILRQTEAGWEPAVAMSAMRPSK